MTHSTSIKYSIILPTDFFFLAGRVGEALHKEKKKSYDSDEDEANPLIIEEEELSGQPDDTQSENDKVNLIISVNIYFDWFKST